MTCGGLCRQAVAQNSREKAPTNLTTTQSEYHGDSSKFLIWGYFLSDSFLITSASARPSCRNILVVLKTSCEDFRLIQIATTDLTTVARVSTKSLAGLKQNQRRECQRCNGVCPFDVPDRMNRQPDQGDKGE